MDFDEARLYYSHQQLQVEVDPESGEPDATATAVDHDDDDDANVDLPAVRRHFREFLRNYRMGHHKYVYREKLLRMHRRWTRRGGADPDAARILASGALATNHNDYNEAPGGGGGEEGAAPGDGVATGTAAATTTANMIIDGASKLEIDLAHVGEYHASLLGHLLNQPARILPCLEAAASDALTSLLYDDVNASRGQLSTTTTTTLPTIPIRSIQVLLTGNLRPTPLRSIQSQHVNKLLRCPGIVIAASPVKNRAIQLTIRCSRCPDSRVLGGGGEGGTTTNGTGGAAPWGGSTNFSFPSTCYGPNPADCGRYPYSAVPDESIFVDQQTWKLQEAPDRVPTGEMPRSVVVAVERSLVDAAPPGTRISVLAIPTLLSGYSSGTSSDPAAAAAKSVFLRVVGLIREGVNDNGGGSAGASFTPAEEEAFRALARHPRVYDLLSNSLAPNLSGSYTIDIKKALTCQLLGGSRKKLPDGVRLRGDINVLLLGDPSMAKSQFLKFVSRVAPVGVYTSGKGSSAAGLTASVVKDAKGEFYLEGGAMVLADGGIVCIDEFDKMRPNDRVAIHEAMEQQTISVAKAGITTVLNSRTSVLAAANPVYGRYDDNRSAAENIDLMTTILSRFDLIFLVRDVREEERDREICKHVMGVHLSSSRAADGGLGHSAAGGGGAASAEGLSYRSAARDDPTDPHGTDSGENGTGVGSTSSEAVAANVLKVATTGEGELDVAAFKKYVQYCKAKCSPRLGEVAGEVLVSSYVKIRDDVRRRSVDAMAAAASSGGGGSNSRADPGQSAVPITVRQLEALVRVSESLAKMRLDSEVRPEDVTEALRLFKSSTLAANAADSVGGGSGGSGVGGGGVGIGGGVGQRDDLDRTEAFLRGRLVLGSLVNKQKIVEEAAGQGLHALWVGRALAAMVGRGEVLERNQGRLLKRLK